MSAGKWKLYEKAKLHLLDGTFDLDDTTNWKAALFTSASNANTLSGSEVYADLTNEVANGSGYLTGGVAIAGQSLANASGTITFDANDVSWTASGGSLTFRYAVIYKNATVNSIIKPLLCVSLLDTTPANIVVNDGNTYSLVMNASGLFTLSGATSD